MATSGEFLMKAVSGKQVHQNINLALALAANQGCSRIRNSTDDMKHHKFSSEDHNCSTKQ
jgi:hypothetical protein